MSPSTLGRSAPSPVIVADACRGRCARLARNAGAGAVTSRVTRCGRRSSRTRDNLVYRWDAGRSAPGAERKAALFDFVYQTYDSSAWIPQSLFDGNLVTQAVVGDVDTIVGKKVGLVLWREQAVVPALRHGAGVRGRTSRCAGR